jgi:ABC-type proline/glycine betaine transport system ATPase subunit
MTNAPALSPIAIRLAGISKRFAHRVKGEVYAVRDVTLAIAPGELLTLLGPSGCGKTTTLRMIAGFEEPDAGTIVIGERDVTRLMANERNIGFVFQNYALFPHLSVFENVAYGLRVQKRPEAEIARTVGEVLALVGLSGYERQAPHQLSGGEQQRVALARAIVFRPRVLLFDEPLSNLDAKLRVQMREEIRDLQRRLGVTTVYVTHDQEEAMAISDRIAVMDRGEIVQIGSAEALYHRRRANSWRVSSAAPICSTGALPGSTETAWRSCSPAMPCGSRGVTRSSPWATPCASSCARNSSSSSRRERVCPEPWFRAPSWARRPSTASAWVIRCCRSRNTRARMDRISSPATW